MTPEDMDLLAALARQRAGLRIESDKAYLVESRLNPLARREGFESIEVMIAALRADRDDRLIWAVVEALTRTRPPSSAIARSSPTCATTCCRACPGKGATGRSASGARLARPARRSIPWR